MTLIQYRDINFRRATEKVIWQADAIIDEYARQHLTINLRQLFYQFVARDLLRNTQANYKRLGSILNDARLAGLISWDSMEDLTRSLRGNRHFASPRDAIEDARRSYRRDTWATQPCRVEVWIEKDALTGVIERPCVELDVDFFSCRGYTSQSEMWRAGQRLKSYIDDDERDVVILHFGDHDPSGIDMTWDIWKRLQLFNTHNDWEFIETYYSKHEAFGRRDFEPIEGRPGVRVIRVALNHDQIKQHRPPPNPIKHTDSRKGTYRRRYGDSAWELDALDPATLSELVRSGVAEFTDKPLMGAAVERQTKERETLGAIIDTLPEDPK